MADAKWWLAAMAIVVGSCGSQTITSSPADTAGTPLSAAAAIEQAAPSTTSDSTIVRHLEHDQLARALPTIAQLAWLPPETTSNDDSDLTSRLDVVDCAGQNSNIASSETAATNRGYDGGQAVVAMVTFYDAETVDGAHQYLAAIGTFLTCAHPPSSSTAPKLSYEIVDVTTPTRCDESLVVRAKQPVSETIDGWCRVGNLIAWFRLYPTGDGTPVEMIATPGDTTPAQSVAAPPIVAPTDASALQTLVTVGENLLAAFDAAGSGSSGRSPLANRTGGSAGRGQPAAA